MNALGYFHKASKGWINILINEFKDRVVFYKIVGLTFLGFLGVFDESNDKLCGIDISEALLNIWWFYFWKEGEFEGSFLIKTFLILSSIQYHRWIVLVKEVNRRQEGEPTMNYLTKTGNKLFGYIVWVVCCIMEKLKEILLLKDKLKAEVAMWKGLLRKVGFIRCTIKDE